MAKVCSVRRLLIKDGVRSLGVVKTDPGIDDAFCLESVSDFVQVDSLLLQGSLQSFDKDIVQITALAIY